VLAAPFAGWTAKQWPLAAYARLGELLHARSIRLVLNIPAAREAQLRGHPVSVQVSGIPGLIDATRRCMAVVGVDSGPLHLAAALAKRGVAIYGPTDPATNGPYGGTITVLRSPAAVSSYTRRRDIDASMESISPGQVFAELMRLIGEPVQGRL
jgi:heptosyltransferase I